MEIFLFDPGLWLDQDLVLCVHLIISWLPSQLIYFEANKVYILYTRCGYICPTTTKMDDGLATVIRGLKRNFVLKA